MDEKQYNEFGGIVQQCESGQYSNINVASDVRSGALIAAWYELDALRGALRQLVEAADPKTNMSMIPLLTALALARTVLKGDAGK